MCTLDLQSPDSYENSFHRVDLDKHTNLELIKYSNLKFNQSDALNVSKLCKQIQHLCYRIHVERKNESLSITKILNRKNAKYLSQLMLRKLLTLLWIQIGIMLPVI